MKRTFIIITAFLLLAVCFLSACDGGNVGDTTSISESSAADITSNEESKEESKEESTDGIIPDNAVKLLFTRYTATKPTFLMIGTCAEGATVTAQLGDESVTVPSYKGWFTASFTKSGTVHEVTFTQTVDGEQIDIPRTYNAVPTTVTGKDASVIASTDEFQFFLTKGLADYEGGNRYSSPDINNMVVRVGKRVEQVQSYNPDAEIIYLIVPSSMTIYPELVPDEYTQGTGETRFDQVAEALTEAGATVIDVRDTFKKHKNDEMPLYYKLDSHWADYGGYLAYVELFNHISEKFPEAAPRGIDEFDWTADYYDSADVCLYLNIPTEEVKEYGYFREFNFDAPTQITSVPRYRLPQLLYHDDTTAQKTFRTNRSELPSCIVYRDSYCAAVYDLIPERMDTTRYMGMWSYAWQSNTVASEKPDYVIYLLAEWNLDSVVYN